MDSGIIFLLLDLVAFIKFSKNITAISIFIPKYYPNTFIMVFERLEE